ncbi:hypothetical protein [Clostridium sp. B9]|uniref:hypothetical protein n=1 Tax=Clostridium sp. B9 TaxID=3423224 RepID=UPI003D2F2434
MEERVENLQRIVKQILATTDDQIQGNLKESLKFRMSVSDNLHGEVRHLKCLKDLAEKKLQEVFREEKFPKDYDTFVKNWENLREEAKYLCNDPKYDYSEERYKYEFIYYEVYCNVYLKYSLGLLFNGNNQSIIDELKKYNDLEIGHMYRYYLHQITLRKLEKSLKVEQFNS